MNVAEQRFLETVPSRLGEIEKQMEAFNANIERLITLLETVYNT